MNLQLNTISKINSLPPDLLFEINDFIDFLYSKHNNKAIDNEIENSMAESDMNHYLSNLNEYESLLAEGKIKW
ncbi:MAG TPA: hypothetical protein PK762_00770 [Candidatus Kapabacteria bacterium]|nr:hypothetical protein [Candidatus Kapabacteria bacterium]